MGKKSSGSPMTKVSMNGLDFPIQSNGIYGSLTNEVERYYFLHYYYILCSYAVNMFEWKNLPDNIPEKFIEYVLCTLGYGCFNKEMGYTFMRCTLVGPYDIYWMPTKFNIFASNGFNKSITNKEGVVIFNNYFRQPTVFYLETYAARMAQAEAFIQVNLNACKTPVLIQCENENQRLSLENAYAKFEGNTPVIVALDKFSLGDKFTAINTNAPYYVDKVITYKKQVWSDALSFLGIRNVDSEKRERLVTAEADGNIQQIEMSRHTMLNARKEGAKLVNQMFGLDIDVDFRLVSNYGDGIFGHMLDDELLEKGGILGGNNDLNATGGNSSV